MSPGPAELVCEGCGARVDALRDPRPFRCPRAGPGPSGVDGDGGDHVLAPASSPRAGTFPTDGDPNPFVRFGELLFVGRAARAAGLDAAAWSELVGRLDRAVEAVDGRGFRETPWRRSEGLERQLDLAGVWVKDETGNVAGSHKARHLMGIALFLEVARAAPDPGVHPVPSEGLAIASCGNAALAAAVLARAVGQRLDVFLPTWADARVVERLQALGARTVPCPREPGVAEGDPCVARFRAEVAAGAVPFTCQGPENGLCLDGGQTLVWELVAQHRREKPLDRLLIQVGGGALASSCVRALRRARELGALERLPALHAVQTRGGHPLERAWRRVTEGILARCRGPRLAEAPEVAAWIHRHASAEVVRDELDRAARARAEFMWPWEVEPRSAATGILDDETYDWRAVVAGMLETGGWPVVAEEERVVEAHALGRAGTDVPVCATGTAGLAGLLELGRAGLLRRGERVGLVFTGVER